MVATSLLAIGAVSASAQDRPADWLKKPTQQDYFNVWPEAAWDKGEGGKALLHCIVAVTGALRDCTVKSESPPGSGFGAAALVLSTQFLMRPELKNGQPVAGEVNIPIAFEAPGKRLGSRLAGPGGGTSVRVYRNFPWLEAPSVADVQAANPPKASDGKTTGFVTLQCTFNKQGGLGGCDTAAEEPKGMGFAAAARSLVPKFRGPTQDSSGKRFDGSLAQLRFTFAPQTMDAASPLIGKPDWTALPAAEDLAAALPEAAKKAGVLKAKVVTACTIAPDGRLTACKVQSEDPPALGYGAAMLKLAGSFRVSLWSTEGLPTIGGAVRIPINFDFSQDQPKPAAAK